MKIAKPDQRNQVRDAWSDQRAAEVQWNGNTFDSLSQVAFAITRSKWNGPRFFGLRDRRSQIKAGGPE
jgi:hypothetical protein